MRLHVVYRSAPGENTTSRPSYYSKDACLGSFLSTLKNPTLPLGDVLFLNDGVIGGARRVAMEKHGRVLELPTIGNAPSYRAALSLLDWQSWSDDDLVYLVEDDYLHVPEALPCLLGAADVLPDAAFFTPYRHPDYFSRCSHRHYRRQTKRSAATVGGVRWEPCWGTPLTYLARISDLRRVAAIHALAARGTYPNDVALWKATQGVGPYRLLHLFVPQTQVRDPDVVVSGVIALLTRQSRKRRLLMFPTPTLATHVQDPFVADGREWEQVATDGLEALW